MAFGAKLRVADDYADADVAGKVYQFMGTDRTLDLGAEDYADFELWKELNQTNLITDSTTFTALSAIGMATGKEGLVGDSQSYYGLIDRNDVRSEVEAYLRDTTVESGGDVVVTALEGASIRALEDSYVVPWEGIGGVIATNAVLSGAEASIRGGRITTTGGGDVVLDSQNASSIDATTTSKMEAWEAQSLVVAFNSIGWKAQNVLFNALDALMGDPLISSAFGGEQPAEVLAYIEDAAIASSGDVRLTAVSQAQLNATVGNENVSEAALDMVFSPTYAAEGVAGGGVLASNKVNSRAAAYIQYTATPGTVQADGAIDDLVAGHGGDQQQQHGAAERDHQQHGGRPGGHRQRVALPATTNTRRPRARGRWRPATGCGWGRLRRRQGRCGRRLRVSGLGHRADRPGPGEFQGPAGVVEEAGGRGGQPRGPVSGAGQFYRLGRPGDRDPGGDERRPQRGRSLHRQRDGNQSAACR